MSSLRFLEIAKSRKDDESFSIWTRRLVHPEEESFSIWTRRLVHPEEEELKIKGYNIIAQARGFLTRNESSDYQSTKTENPEIRYFTSAWDYDTSDDIVFKKNGSVSKIRAVKFTRSGGIYRSSEAYDKNCEIIQMKMYDGSLHWILMPKKSSGRKDLINLVNSINWLNLHCTFSEDKSSIVHIPKFVIEKSYIPNQNYKNSWPFIEINEGKSEITEDDSKEQDVIIIDKPFVFVNCDCDGSIQEMGMFLNVNGNIDNNDINKPFLLFITAIGFVTGYWIQKYLSEYKFLNYWCKLLFFNKS